MNTTPKWLSRAGSLLILMGFFMPAASCTAYSVKVTSFSLSDLAGQESFLYLVLLGALGALIATLIPALNKTQETWLLMGQIAGLGLGALSFLWTILSLSSQLSQFGMSLSPELGFFVLVLGYGLSGAGIFQSLAQLGPLALRAPPGNSRAPDESRPVRASPPTGAGARLELVRGRGPASVPIRGTDFLIGRGHRNDLVLSDTIVSGLHARLRYAEGAWFIQDQNSSNGIFVNGKRTKAQRLHDGDQIRLGETTFIFRI